MGRSPDDETDLDLLAAWRDGDGHAGGALFKRHAPAISRFFGNKLAGADDTADLLQETFLALLRSRGGDADVGSISVRGYLYAIANNVLCAHLRKKYKRHSEQLDFTSVCLKDLEPASLSSLVMKRRESQTFVEALRAIPLQDQILLEAKYFDGLSLRDIAEFLAVAETTLPGRLQRAKSRLRQKIEQLAAQLPGAAAGEPADDDLETWAREVREQMGWQDSG